MQWSHTAPATTNTCYHTSRDHTQHLQSVVTQTCVITHALITQHLQSQTLAITHSTCIHKHLLSHRQWSHTAPATTTIWYHTQHLQPLGMTQAAIMHLQPQPLCITQAVVTHSTSNHKYLVSNRLWSHSTCNHLASHSDHTQHLQPLGVSQAVITHSICNHLVSHRQRSHTAYATTNTWYQHTQSQQSTHSFSSHRYLIPHWLWSHVAPLINRSVHAHCFHLLTKTKNLVDEKCPVPLTIAS